MSDRHEPTALHRHLGQAALMFSSTPSNVFLDAVPSELQDQVLAEFGLTERRGGKLPLRLMLQLVVAMALRPDHSITAVLRELVSVVGAPLTWRGSFPQSSSITTARDRLGSEVVKRLLELHSSATDDALGSLTWKGLRVAAVDGTTMRTPDTKANEEAFGRPGGRNGAAGFPALRLLALVDVESHQVRAAAIAGCKGEGTGELSLARRELLDVVPPKTVLLFDRGFYSFAWQRALVDRKVPFVVRMKTGKKDLKPILGEVFKRGADWDAELPVPKGFPNRASQSPIPLRLLKWTPPKKRSMRSKSKRKRLRGTSVQKVKKATKTRGEKKKTKRKRRRQVALLTNLVDRKTYPCEEVVALYLKRWEVEFAFREIKATLTARKVEFRSKRPDRVRQEAYALLLAYNLLRLRMTQAARLVNLSPNRLSFKDCLVATRSAYATNSPLATLLGKIKLYELPKRKPRSYPRAVKSRATRYPTKPNAKAA